MHIKSDLNFRARLDAVSYSHTESTVPWTSYDAPKAVKELIGVSLKEYSFNPSFKVVLYSS